MGLLFVYILKSSVCLAMFYLFYRLLLSRETFHRFNRFALLGILLLSCLLPLIEVSVGQQTDVQHTVMTLEQWLAAASAAGAATTDIQPRAVTVTWIQVALLAYVAGMVVFVFRNGYSLCRLCRLLRSGRKERADKYIATPKNVQLIVHDRQIAPFSWMNHIVISAKDLEEDGRAILIHEMAHISNRHSWDLLLADICIVFQWFNPAAWLLKQELQNIHEYEADETVIREGVDAKQYQLLLIKKAVGTRLYSMANSFNHSKLKKRITMMLKEKSSPWARLRYLYVLPLAAVAVTAFARPEVSNTVEEISAVKVNDLAGIAETKVAESLGILTKAAEANALPGDTAKPAEVKYIPAGARKQLKGTPVLQIVDDMPEFPGGGMEALAQYFKKNMRYPESAKAKKSEGRVTVQFVIDKDGSVKEPTVARSTDKDMEAEAVRLVKAMPKWKPGSHKGVPVDVRFVVPVVFSLDEGKPAERGAGDDSGATVSTSSKTSDVMVLIDGKEVDPSILEVIDNRKIKAINVLKDEESLKKYGAQGKSGIMMITLKKKDDASTDGAGLADGSAGIYVVGKKGEAAEKASGKDGMKVKGTVVDEQGKPVVGATVLVEGTTTGTVVDLDGKFLLSVPSEDAVIVVSFMDRPTVKVKAQPEIAVTLKSK